MDPATVILSALSAGAVSAFQDTASAAVKDAYNGLVKLISKKFSKNTKAKAALGNHQKKPKGTHKTLKKALMDTKATEDTDILCAAEKLLDLISKQQAALNYDLIINGDAQGVIQENKGTVTMNFSAPIKKQSRKKQ